MIKKKNVIGIYVIVSIVFILTSADPAMGVLPYTVNFTTSGLPSGVSITIDVTNHGYSGSVTFISPGPSNDTANWPSELFIYSGFPTSITVGGSTYNLLGTFRESPFITGSVGTGETVTATYVKDSDLPPPPAPESSTFILTVTGLVGLFGLAMLKRRN